MLVLELTALLADRRELALDGGIGRTRGCNQRVALEIDGGQRVLQRRGPLRQQRLLALDLALPFREGDELALERHAAGAVAIALRRKLFARHAEFLELRRHQRAQIAQLVGRARAALEQRRRHAAQPNQRAAGD